MNRNSAKKKQGSIDSLSGPWKQSLKRNTRKKSRQKAKQKIKEEKKEFCPECFDDMTTGYFCKLCGRKLQ